MKQNDRERNKTSVMERYSDNDSVLSFILPADAEGEKVQAFSDLSQNEEQLKDECEATIGKACESYRGASKALLTIRERRLYRDEYSTFEEYCRVEWGFSRQRAYELTKAAETREEL